MPRTSYPTRRLSMESLETRTLLAGGSDPFGLLADFDLTKTALTGSGDFSASFSTNFGNKLLILTGTHETDLTIDLDKLPAFITNLRISSFSDVKFIGSDHVDTLVLTDIDTVTAPNLTVTSSLHADDVHSLTLLGSTGELTLLKGNAMTLNIANLDDTTIYSEVGSLTVNSQTKSLYVVGLNDTQTVQLGYTPEFVGVTGMPLTSVHVVLPGSATVGGGSGSIPETNIPPLTGIGGGPGTGSTAVPDVITNPIGGSDSHSNPGSTPETQSPVVIVSIPADERTRAFIAELRVLLHSNTSDSDQFLSALIAHSGPNATGLSSLPKSAVFTSIPALEKPATLRVEIDGHLLEMHGTFETQAAPASDGAPTGAPLVLERGPDGEIFVDRQLNVFPGANELVNLAVGPSIDVALAAPVAAPATNPSDSPRARSSDLATDAKESTTEIGAGMLALGHYIVERVSAEFSPGHQSVVLLVDPRPSRPTINSNQSALDLFARGGDALNRKTQS